LSNSPFSTHREIAACSFATTHQRLARPWHHPWI